MGETSNEPTEIMDDEIFGVVRDKIEAWDFEHSSPEQTTFFTFHLSHWLLETYGDENNEGTITVYGREELPGEFLPEALQGLLMYEWGNELHVSGENKLSMNNQAMYVEHDAVIPKWEEMEELSYPERLQRMRSDPDIYNNLIQARIEVYPEVTIGFRPFYSLGWGLEFVVNPRSIQAAPFGDKGKTWKAFEYATGQASHFAELSHTVCELALLCASQASWRSDRRSSRVPSRPATVLDTLERRLAGLEGVPFTMKDFNFKPENAMKVLLINILSDPESDEE